MVVVGAISYSALKKHIQKTHAGQETACIKPVPACLLKKNVFGLQVSTRRKNEIRDDGFVGIVIAGEQKPSPESIQRLLQIQFDEKVEPAAESGKPGCFKGLKTGMNILWRFVCTGSN